MNKITYSYSSDGSSPASDWEPGSSATYAKGKWSTQRNSTVYFVGTDNAGNKTVKDVGKVKIDTTRPYSTYVGNSWFSGDIYVDSNTCKNIGGILADVVCDVYVTTGTSSTWDFDTSNSTTDAGGSGLNRVEQYWDHNGSSDNKYPNWTSDCCGNWKADEGGSNKATWITWGARGVDNVGNVGYTMTFRMHITYR